MFKKIVWATDGSDAADHALALAKRLAVEGGGELLAVHCEEFTRPVT
jgi:nucleotide-binding universal stress UspA family protein